MDTEKLQQAIQEALDALERLSRIGCRQSRNVAKQALAIVKSTLKEADAKDSRV